MSPSLRRTSAMALLLAGLAAASLRGVAAQADPCQGTAFSSPTSGAVISGTVALLGSARIENFGFYKLEWASETRPAAWSAVSDIVTTPVEQGVLDRWNSQSVPDGLYRLKLTVVDTVGQEICRQTASRLQVANRSALGTATPTATATAEAADPGDGSESGDDANGEPSATSAAGVPTPVSREGSSADGGDGTAEDADGGDAADDATPAPVDLAPAAEPSGARLPSLGELSFCFGAGFLATVALALWLWRRQGTWTG